MCGSLPMPPPHAATHTAQGSRVRGDRLLYDGAWAHSGGHGSRGKQNQKKQIDE